MTQYEQLKQLDIQGIINQLKERNHTPVLIGVMGSQQYGLADDKSDIDLIVYTLPTKYELLTNQHNNKEYQLDKQVSVTCNTIQSLARQIGKYSVNLFEALNDPLYIHDDWKPVFQYIKERIHEDEGVNQLLAKNFYFMGMRYFNQYLKEPNSKGSGIEHYEGNINWKALSKARLFQLLVLKGAINESYEQHQVPLDIKQEYSQLREKHVADDTLLQTVTDFYSNAQKDKMVRLPNRLSEETTHRMVHALADNLTLDETH